MTVGFWKEDREGRTESRPGPGRQRPAEWALLGVGLLVLTLACWLDHRVLGAGERGRVSASGGSRPFHSPSTPHPEDRVPGTDPLLQAVIVNRLVRRPGSAPCLEDPLWEMVERYATRHGLDGRWVAAVIEAESGFDPEAFSEDGAVGLMQLLPETALDFGARDPWDPVQNVEAGVRYLKALLDRYGGDVATALAAYNAGPEQVERTGAWPVETRAFVRRVLGAYDRLQKACPARSIF